MSAIRLLTVILIGIICLGYTAAQCTVGELSNDGDPVCHDQSQKSTDACTALCQNKYGSGVQTATCSQPRANGQRECQCSLSADSCIKSEGTGDPHYVSFDGVRFSYQGLSKHYLIRPCKSYKEFPEFELRQTNLRIANSKVSYTHKHELVWPEVGMMVEITQPELNKPVEFGLKVNGQKKNIPYTFEQERGRILDFIKVDYVPNSNKQQVQLTTSFGLKSTLGVAVMYLALPPHPDLKGNSCGLLGRWNGDPNDDSVDANGVKRTFADVVFGFDEGSVAFGDSWIVEGDQSSICTWEQAKKEQEEIDKKTDPAVKERVTKMCKNTIDQIAVKDCQNAVKRKGYTVEECVADLLYMPDQQAQEKFLANIIKNQAIHCDKDIPINGADGKPIGVVGPGANANNFGGAGNGGDGGNGGGAGGNGGNGCCQEAQKDLTPLYRVFAAATETRNYLTDLDEYNKLLTAGVFKPDEKSPGFVSLKQKDCKCNDGLKPVYRLYGAAGQGGRPANRQSYIYTLDKAEADNLVKTQAYQNQGVAFYCSSNKNECGATFGLRSYKKAGDQVLTTNQAEGQKLKAAGYTGSDDPICYIWPPAKL